MHSCFEDVNASIVVNLFQDTLLSACTIISFRLINLFINTVLIVLIRSKVMFDSSPIYATPQLHTFRLNPGNRFSPRARVYLGWVCFRPGRWMQPDRFTVNSPLVPYLYVMFQAFINSFFIIYFLCSVIHDLVALKCDGCCTAVPTTNSTMI